MVSPLERPADLDSPLPQQVLLAFFGCFLVLIEGAFAQWTVFFAAAPMITLVYIYYMNLFHASRLSVLAVFIMGLFSELMFWQALGVNATSFCLATLLTRLRAPQLVHADFLEIWSAFSLLVIFVCVFRLVAYAVFYISVPDIEAVFLQAGMTILLFPVFYVLLFSAASARKFLETRLLQ